MVSATSIAEIEEGAIKQLTTGKSFGNDDIPVERYKCGSSLVICKIHDLFSLIWDSGSVP